MRHAPLPCSLDSVRCTNLVKGRGPDGFAGGAGKRRRFPGNRTTFPRRFKVSSHGSPERLAAADRDFDRTEAQHVTCFTLTRSRGCISTALARVPFLLPASATHQTPCGSRSNQAWNFDTLGWRNTMSLLRARPTEIRSKYVPSWTRLSNVIAKCRACARRRRNSTTLTPVGSSFGVNAFGTSFTSATTV